MLYSPTRSCLSVLLILALLMTPHSQATSQSEANARKPLTVTDIMKFRAIEGTVISDNGQWVAWTEKPDRGDSVGHVASADGTKQYQFDLAALPEFSSDNNWITFKRQVPLLKMTMAKGKDKKKLKAGLLLVNLTDGKARMFDSVKRAAFTGDASTLVVHYFEDDKKPKSKATDKEEDKKTEKTSKQENPVNEGGNELAIENKSTTEKRNEKKPGEKSDVRKPSQLAMFNLASSTPDTLDKILSFAVAETSGNIAIVEMDEKNENNSIIIRQSADRIIKRISAKDVRGLSWNHKGSQLAWLQNNEPKKKASNDRPAEKDGAVDDAFEKQYQLYAFRVKNKRLISAKISRPGWFISKHGKLEWSKDDKRVFFGFKPIKNEKSVNTAIKEEQDLYNLEKLRAKKSLRVWHLKDKKIQTQQAVEYKEQQKFVYQSIWMPAKNKWIKLTDETVTHTSKSDNPNAILASSMEPWRWQATWKGLWADFYHINLKSGKRQLIANHLKANLPVKISPNGRYTVYYRDGDFWRFDSRKSKTVNLTQPIRKNEQIQFSNELHDYPSPPPGYGIAGWLDNSEAVLLYDRYDIWQIDNRGRYKNLTRSAGRSTQTVYRIVDTDEENEFIQHNSLQLIKAYHEDNKQHGFYQLHLSKQQLTLLVDGEKKYQFIGKAKKHSNWLFSREDFDEFPDLRLAISNESKLLSDSRQLSNANPQITDFLWGQKPELISWTSTQGKPLQGVLIKPANYQPGQRVPVVVYYYRYFSQRMYEFNQMKVNHRPNFPFYTSNGYAIFLPDVKFEVGHPGASATAALVPGVQKLIDMGVADANAIGLHGHSWSGYQTAFVVTQTDVFKAAVAGAPVTNMTSAYSGIRLGSGLARQFQYEQSQSRIGASLYDKPHLYFENSPIFFADRIHTPLLLMHGDIDDAVPWQQSIELYLAMRRQNKPVIFLQYEGEPHHLKKYPNKVDYTLKMKEFFDHHLKGEPAPEWMVSGKSYRPTKPEPAL